MMTQEDRNRAERKLRAAGRIAALPPLAVRMIKELLTVNGSDGDLKAVMARESEQLRVAMKSTDHKEAIAAFLEKREPKFR